MCEICAAQTRDEKMKVHNDLLYRAEQLEAMARHLRELAAGTAHPHSPAHAPSHLLLAHSIIRYLVEEYV
jgi:hypothetical protein